MQGVNSRFFFSALLYFSLLHQVNLKEQGHLIRQDEFTVFFKKKKCVRRIFLFEDLVLFSKTKRTDIGNDVYVYKQSFKVCTHPRLSKGIGALIPNLIFYCHDIQYSILHSCFPVILIYTSKPSGASSMQSFLVKLKHLTTYDYFHLCNFCVSLFVFSPRQVTLG